MSRGHVPKNLDGGEFRSVLSGSAVLCGRFQYFIVVYWFVQEKKSKPTTKKIANKQNQPNKQEKTLTNFFLPRCRFFYLCFAEDLSSEESCRRLVSDAVWQRLKYYFPAACEFTSVHSVCRLCQVRPDSFEPSFWLITTPRMRVAWCQTTAA